MRYILINQTGKGFYTTEDRVKMSTFKILKGLAIVDGDCNEWIQKVNGEEISENEANKILEKKLKKKDCFIVVQEFMLKIGEKIVIQQRSHNKKN